MFEPAYLRLYHEGKLGDRIAESLTLLKACQLCPRDCGVNRLEGEEGLCRTGRQARVASFNAHFGEEDPLVGRHGSGTIFISSCSLLCRFCQNYEISHGREGVDVEPDQMAAMMIQLAERGCHNINIVTPTHVVPQILEALPLAIKAGLKIPLVYNCSGYEKMSTLEALEGIFDIYMPDFKFWDHQWAEAYCQAPDYPDVAKKALKEMHRQVGDLHLDDDGMAMKGLLVRHLVMPNQIGGTEKIMRFLANEISANTYVNVMDQYRPCGDLAKEPFINRRLSPEEFREAMDQAKKADLKRLDKRDRPGLVFSL